MTRINKNLEMKPVGCLWCAHGKRNLFFTSEIRDIRGSYSGFRAKNKNGELGKISPPKPPGCAAEPN